MRGGGGEGGGGGGEVSKAHFTPALPLKKTLEEDRAEVDRTHTEAWHAEVLCNACRMVHPFISQRCEAQTQGAAQQPIHVGHDLKDWPHVTLWA